MATQYWTEVVKQQLVADCPNQILAAHLSPDETAVPGWSNNSSRYWNRKFKGEPASRESKIDQTDIIVPGSKAILLHPLWHLLDANEHSDQLLNRALLALPSEMHTKLFQSSSNGTIRRRKDPHRKFLIKLYSMNSLDALACIFALALEDRSNVSQLRSNNYEMGLLKIFLRLSVLTELKVICRPLYNRISDIFNHSEIDLRRLKPVHLRQSLPLQIFPHEWLSIDRLITAYVDLIDTALKVGIIADSQHEKLLLLYSTNHTSFHTARTELAELSDPRMTVGCLGSDARAAIRNLEFHLKK